MIPKFSRSLDGRAVSLAMLCTLGLGIMLCRLWQLMVMNGDEYTTAIQSQVIRPVRLAPVRGMIDSSDGIHLADNAQRFALDLFIGEFTLPPLSARQHSARAALAQLKNIEGRLRLPLLLDEKTIAEALADEPSARPDLIAFKGLTQDHVNQLRKLLLLEDFTVCKNRQLLLRCSLVPALKPLSARHTTATALLDEADQVANLIARPHNLDMDKVIDHLIRYSALPLRVYEDLSAAEIAVISESRPQGKSLQIVANPHRTTPHPMAFSHLIGFTGRQDPGTEDDRDEFFYYLPDLWGRDGLERALDSHLAGKGGKKLALVNIAGYEKRLDEHSTHKLKLDQLTVYPQHGANVTLTINAQAQLIAYDLMKDLRGALVCMDVHSGAIIAMVSTPAYDINRIHNITYYNSLISGVPGLPDIKQPAPMRNRALNAAYMPGSIIKPLVALTALDDGLISPSTSHLCDGMYDLGGGTRIRCHDRAGHGPLTLKDAIRTSCNPYFVHLARNIDFDHLRRSFQAAGFGPRLGLLPDPTSFLPYQTDGHLPNHAAARLGELSYICIGQGQITISPLQACMMAASIANRGRTPTPYLVERIAAAKTGEPAYQHQSATFAQLPVQPHCFDPVIQAMRSVVASPGGTAHGIHSATGIQLACKTGTAQVPFSWRDSQGQVQRSLQRNCWLVGFGPWESPQYAIAVLVEDGVSGGGSAGPVARRFFDRWLGNGESTINEAGSALED